MAKRVSTEAERRLFSRLPHRVACEFTFEGRKCAGIVTDVSARGIFVETTARIPNGTELRFVLRGPRGSLELVGRVTRERRSHRDARQVVATGFGIALDVIPEAFFGLLVERGLG